METTLTPNHSSIVEGLKKESENNACFKAVLKVFANRKRARQQITLATLKLKMSKEGFNFPQVQYENVLKSLADLGIGKLDFDPKGQLRSLKNIKLTLQSIGKAALNKEQKLSILRLSTEFEDVPNTEAVIKAPLIVASNPLPIEYPIAITVKIDGESISFPLPKGLTTKELGALLADLYHNKI